MQSDSNALISNLDYIEQISKIHNFLIFLSVTCQKYGHFPFLKRLEFHPKKGHEEIALNSLTLKLSHNSNLNLLIINFGA